MRVVIVLVIISLFCISACGSEQELNTDDSGWESLNSLINEEAKDGWYLRVGADGQPYWDEWPPEPKPLGNATYLEFLGDHAVLSITRLTNHDLDVYPKDSAMPQPPWIVLGDNGTVWRVDIKYSSYVCDGVE